MRYRRSLLPIIAVAMFTEGCRLFRPVNPNPTPNDERTEAPAAPVETPADAPPTPPVEVQSSQPREIGKVNDATIAAMLLASNNTDISYARLVPSRADRADVRSFAQRMLTDHTGINALVTELLGKLELTPEDNLASLDMRDESATRRDVMRDLRGFAFDSAYATNEISYHRRFLEALDNIMVPRARNDELKTLLTSIRPAVAAHLAHAEQLWANVMTRK